MGRKLATFFRQLKHLSFARMKLHINAVHGETGKNRLAIFCDMVWCEVRYGIGYLAVKSGAIIHGINQSCKYRRRQVFKHFFSVEYIFTEVFSRSFVRGRYFHGFSLEGLFYYSES